MMSANSSMKEQSPRSIQWRFFVPLLRVLPANGGDPLRTGATEKDRCLAEKQGEAFCLFPALMHGDWPWWFKWVRPAGAGVIPHWGFRPFNAL